MKNKMTNRQKTFAQKIVEGIYSNAESARLAGYNEERANEHASRLLNGRDYPHVLEYIKELREEKERRYGVTLLGQLERLHKLSLGAEDEGQFSAAINAEKIRSALGGLTIDRRETTHTIDQLSRDEIVARLADMRKKYPQAFIIDGEFKDVTDGKRIESLAATEKELTLEHDSHKD
jgi:phage terminase small subunit